MKKIIYRTGLIFLLSAALLKAQAQLSLSAQIRTRTEFRNGVGILKPKVNDPAFFTSQRSRLTFNYKTNRVILNAALQDVRVWGQDASTISNADGNKLGLHEGWAELILANIKDSSYLAHSALSERRFLHLTLMLRPAV